MELYTLGSIIINLILLVYVYFYVKFNILHFILIVNAVIFTGIRGIYPVAEGYKKMYV